MKCEDRGARALADWRPERGVATLLAMSQELSRTDLKHFSEALLTILKRSTQTRDQIEDESFDLKQGGVDWQGDRGSARSFEEVDIDSLELENENARAAAAALKRISEGTYGVCTECAGSIPRGRLQAMPAAALCLACEEAFEAETE